MLNMSTMITGRKWAAIAAATAFLGLLLSFISPDFLTVTNLQSILVQASVTAIMAVGMTYVIIVGGIDISVGAILFFVSSLFAQLMETTGSPALAFGAAILTVIFYAYAPYLSHDLLPGLLFAVMIFLAHRWIDSGGMREAVQCERSEQLQVHQHSVCRKYEPAQPGTLGCHKSEREHQRHRAYEEVHIDRKKSRIGTNIEQPSQRPMAGALSQGTGRKPEPDEQAAPDHILILGDINVQHPPGAVETDIGYPDRHHFTRGDHPRSPIRHFT